MSTELINRNAQLSTLSNLAYKPNPPETVNGWTRMPNVLALRRLVWNLTSPALMHKPGW
jgi:hypothetical protein